MSAATGAKSSIGTSAVALTATSNPISYKVGIRAASGNSGTVYVGLSSGVTAGSDDATDGFPLAAGEYTELTRSAVSDTTGVYLIASGAGQKVFWAVDVLDDLSVASSSSGGSVTNSESIADDAAFTVATSKVFPSGYLADETATDSVDEGDVGLARMTLDRKVQVVVEQESSSLRAAGTALVPKFAAIAAATSGDNTLVAAVTSKKIRVLALCLVAGAAGNVYFTSAVGGSVIFGGSTNKINLAINGGFVLPFNPVGWFETSSGHLLNMNASSTGPFSGGLTYIEV